MPVVPAALTPSTGPLVLPAGRPMAVFPVACSGHHMTRSTWSADWCQVWTAGRPAQTSCTAVGQGCMPSPQLTRMALALTPALAAWKARGRKAHNQIVPGHLAEAVTAAHREQLSCRTRWHAVAHTPAHVCTPAVHSLLPESLAMHSRLVTVSATSSASKVTVVWPSSVLPAVTLMARASVPALAASIDERLSALDVRLASGGGNASGVPLHKVMRKGWPSPAERSSPLPTHGWLLSARAHQHPRRSLSAG